MATKQYHSYSFTLMNSKAGLYKTEYASTQASLEKKMNKAIRDKEYDGIDYEVVVATITHEPLKKGYLDHESSKNLGPWDGASHIKPFDN